MQPAQRSRDDDESRQSEYPKSRGSIAIEPVKWIADQLEDDRARLILDEHFRRGANSALPNARNPSRGPERLDRQVWIQEPKTDLHAAGSNLSDSITIQIWKNL